MYIYISIHSYVKAEESGILVQVRSDLCPDFPDFLQWVLDSMMDPASEYYRPGYAWDTEEITILYHGLAVEPETQFFGLKDGRTAIMWNNNSGCTNEIAQAYKDYAAAVDLARASLMSGDSAEEAARKMWAYCLETKTYPSVLIKPVMSFQNVVADMTRLREALLDSGEDLPNGNALWPTNLCKS